MVKSLTPTEERRETRASRWSLRRVIALALIVSGLCWLIAGLVIRFLFF
jgi:hypothetical protein